MAVVYQTEEEEKKKELAGQGVQTMGQPLGEEPEGGLQTGGGTGSLVQGSGGGAASPSQRGTSSGSFTNLQSYLDANKNENLGQNVAGRIQGEVDQAKAAQQSAGQGFRGLVDQAKVGTDQSLLDRIKQDARAVAGSEADKTAFDKMRKAEYKGPGSLAETQDLYNPAYKETAEAQEQLNAAKTLEGRKGILKGMGGAQYSKGQAKLDNLLLQNDPNARNAFQNLQSGNQNLQADYDKLLGELGDYAGKAKTDTAAARTAAEGALSTGISDTRGKASKRLTSRLGEIQQAKEYRDALNRGDLSKIGAEKALSMFGVSPDFRTYGVNAGDYLNIADENQLNENTVRNQEEADVLRALEQLGGDVSGVNFEGAGLFDDENLSNFRGADYSNDRSARQRNVTGALGKKDIGGIKYASGMTDNKGRVIEKSLGSYSGAGPGGNKDRSWHNISEGVNASIKQARELLAKEPNEANWQRMLKGALNARAALDNEESGAGRELGYDMNTRFRT